jgi:hypothetical protein
VNVWRLVAGLLAVLPLHESRALPPNPLNSGETAPAAAPWCEPTWRWASPTPQGFDLLDVTWAGTLSRFVAVGRGGAAITSGDGLAWSPLVPDLTDDINAVAGGSGLLVAAGARVATRSPMFLSSRDGVAWEARDTAEHAGVAGAVTAVAWDGARFVALDENGTVRTSADGERWPTLGTAIAGVPWFRPNALTWTGAELVAAGYGKVTMPGATGGIVLTSDDAVTWAVAFFAPGCRFQRVAFSPTAVIVVGSNGVVAERIGGVWSSARLEGDLAGAVWTGERFLATGATASLPHLPLVYASPDGASWVPENAPALARVRAFAAGAGRLVAVGEHGACASSGDGRAWLRVDRALAGFFQSVAWIGSSFLAVGDGGRLATSPDGASWIEQQGPTTEHLHDVVWADGRVLVVGNNGTALLGGDGQVWESQETGTSVPLMSAVWDGARFVVAGGDLESGYAVLASPDGVRWELLSDATTPPIRRLVWTGRTLIGIGRGEIHESLDAVRWTPVPIESAPCHSALGTTPSAAASNGRLTVVLTHDARCDVAGTCTSVPLVSADGDAWQCGEDIPLAFAVAFNGTQFVAVGEDGTISTSFDGVTWAREQGRGSPSATLSAIASSPTTTVAAGGEGTVVHKSCPRPLILRRRLRRL